ncbi:MAG TPA: ABC transporter ATP-binding protein [Anaerolineales bacterium]|nr:ABC transporter ATP-binding protein [Anaerolineales bacterium]
MLKIENLSKIYRVGTFGGQELRAVDQVSFEVGDRQVVSLIGESGSGKSTIGKMILGLISKSSGSICFDGMETSTLKNGTLKEYYRKVQGVFQDPFSSYNPIFKADRVFKLIKDEFFPNVDTREWEGKVENALKSVGLNPENVQNKFPHQLSGGQLQRLLIARALLLDIQLLVADEVISMLDASTRIDVLNLLADLKSRGLSILFITHDLCLGYYISDQSVILYKGNVLEKGLTEKIYSNPLHPYTQMLMDSVPRLDKKWKNVAVESKSRQSTLTSGCGYYDRCPLACSKCSHKPALVEITKGHSVACWQQTEITSTASRSAGDLVPA